MNPDPNPNSNHNRNNLNDLLDTIILLGYDVRIGWSIKGRTDFYRPTHIERDLPTRCDFSTSKSK